MAESRTARNWRKALEKLEGAYAPNTLRAYRADFEIFEGWCQKNRRSPLPASPGTVAGFFQAQQEVVSPTTLRRRQSAIRKIHRLLRLPNPADDEEVNIALRRAKRMKGRRAKQALGLTRELRDQLITAAPETPRGLRDIALICVGYDTLCRRSELSALDITALQTNPDGTMTVLVRRAKNDPFGDGRLSILSKVTVRHLRRWIRAAKIKEGPVFRSIDRHENVRPQSLDASSINRILKRAAKDTGLSASVVQNLSGHSMRVGRAQDLMLQGFGLLPIMKAGGWKSFSVVARYVENVELSKLLKARGAWD